MTNTNGYSMILHGINNIIEIKNTYILNEINTSSYELYPVNADALYDFSSNLNHSNYDLIFT